MLLVFSSTASSFLSLYTVTMLHVSTCLLKKLDDDDDDDDDDDGDEQRIEELPLKMLSLCCFNGATSTVVTVRKLSKVAS